MHRCTVCNDWYPATGTGITDICVPCLELNFAGAQPALDLTAPAREALEAYVYPNHQSMPRQVQALARLHVYGQHRQAGEER